MTPRARRIILYHRDHRDLAKRIFRFILSSVLILLFGAASFLMGAVTLGGSSPTMVLEWIADQTPQARIAAYLRAIQAQDRDSALEVWMLPQEGSVSFAALSERRSSVTDELLGRRITGFMIFEPQWWSTCCDPGVIQQARNAGGARVRVQVLDDRGRPWSYTFDVFVDSPYFGDAAGNPYRRWQLRDVYPVGELPLFWTLVYTGEVHRP